LEIRSNAVAIGDVPNPNATTVTEWRIDGVAVSRGVGMGSVVMFERGNQRFERIADERPNADTEISRFRLAVDRSIEELRSLIDAADVTPNGHLTDILNIQLLILEQSSFVSNVEDEMQSARLTAESALQNVQLRYAEKMASVHDPHHREKRLDIEDVCNRIAAALSGETRKQQTTYRDFVVAAHELTPSEMVEVCRQSPAAIITERGGWTSHSSILAREFQVPMVSGVKSIETKFLGGEMVIVDGQKGRIIVDPSEISLSTYAVNTEISISDGPPSEIGGGGTQTIDGTNITIRANADSEAAFTLAKQAGADGIGLFRSESLIGKPGRIPDEDAQIRAYSQIGSAVGDQGVRIRTFDIGIERYSPNGRHTEINPSLGLRSIRLSLHERSYFRVQIRALLRAAAHHGIAIVLPMISGVGEVEEAMAMIEAERKELSLKGVEHGSPQIGAMIEVPSAIFTAREIAAKVDFLALGTNDLVQYLLAVDRDNDQVSELYQTLNPAVIRALRAVIDAAESSRKPLLICGEMAGSAFYVPLLIGLGARELSMNSNSISQIRHLISGIGLADAQSLAASVDIAETADQVEAILRKFYKEHWQTLFPSGLLDAKHR